MSEVSSLTAGRTHRTESDDTPVDLKDLQIDQLKERIEGVIKVPAIFATFPQFFDTIW